MEASMTKTETAEAELTSVSSEELRQAYRIAVRTRTTEEYIVRLVSRGEVKFSIWGPGEEVHGVATSLALSRVFSPENFGFVPHYRSGGLVAMWLALNGHENFALELMRQQFSKETDEMSRGRQMVNHLHYPDYGILPVQSPVGMQLGKAAGWAMGYKLLGRSDAAAMAIIGDGTTAEGDLHDAMNAASVWKLPLIVMVTDNNVAISTEPHEGNGIKDFAAYAKAFDFRHFECDGGDFWSSYETMLAAATHARYEQSGVLIHVDNLPRLNGHSSAADVTFDLSQPDPILSFGDALVERGVLGEDDIVRRKEATGRDYFAHHVPGSIMAEEIETVREIISQVRAEPDPPGESVLENIYAPFPAVIEPPTTGRTNITVAGAIRAALDRIISDHNGVLWGQDVARLGGVMTATSGLKARHPERVIDAPLNEPLIVGTAMGAGLHPDITALPEIQFGDYAYNAFHWLVYLGNLYWSSNGNASSSVILRMPTDPFGGGAIYHSMSNDGYFSSIPGLVLVMPSTSFDAYGLLMTAAEYNGPVVFLEPKFMYRLHIGPAFPGEPTDPDAIDKLRKDVLHGGIPEIDPSIRVPFGKAATRRHGDDLTIVAWGRAVYTALDAATRLESQGIQAEVIDLRTLVPPDLDSVYESVGRTGRLVVAAEDRAFAGFVRSIQGHVVERYPGTPTRALGQKNVPGIAQSPSLEKATVLNVDDIFSAAVEVAEAEIAGSGTTGWSWMPRRYYEA
jgi:2-oxoisovalerate dehydrogenase E1 component